MEFKKYLPRLILTAVLTTSVFAMMVGLRYKMLIEEYSTKQGKKIFQR